LISSPGPWVNGGSATIPSGRINARSIDVNGDGIPDPLDLCGAGVQFCTNDGSGGFRPFVSPADLYNFQLVNYLYTPSSRSNAYTAGSFTLGTGVEGFFEASYLHRASDQQLAPTPLTLGQFGLSVSRDSIFNPFGGDVFGYNRRLEEFGPRRSSQSVDTFRTVVGLRSSTSGDASAANRWNWELSFNLGRTDATQKLEGDLIVSRLRNAIGPSFINSSGTPTCGTPFAPIPGCVPMNLLGPSGSISPEARDYATFTGNETGVNEQQMALATAQGRIARLPNHGDISLAVSADVRKETGELTPDPLVASGDTTHPAPPLVQGSTQAIEAAAELSIVPVRDRDGVERLEIDLAARAFRYDSFGSGVISDVRALARPVRGITLRSTYSAAFRAPSVAELFQGNVDRFPFAADPCDHAFGVGPAGGAIASPTSDECAREGVPPDAIFGTRQQHAIEHGNPQLDPETAKVLTAGVVLQSSYCNSRTDRNCSTKNEPK
jgi:outer membrane receptor protein involved in Fe transport